MTKKYAGIGSRETPEQILQLFEELAFKLGKDDWVLGTGAATGADQAFMRGAAQSDSWMLLYLPWPGYEKEVIKKYNQHSVTIKNAGEDPFGKEMLRFHPRGSSLPNAVKKLHARNGAIIRDSRFVVCWTPDGKISGGTGQGIRIAEYLGIEVINAGDEEGYRRITKFVNEQ